MDEKNIKVGNLWIEESNAIKKKIFGFYFLSITTFILISYFSMKYYNLLLSFLTILLCVFMVIYLEINISFPPSLSNDLFAIHYTTNIDFTKDTGSYTKMFELMKKYYENENLMKKQQKYKIKKTIFLYDKYSKNEISWVKEQNRKIKLLECKF